MHLVYELDTHIDISSSSSLLLLYYYYYNVDKAKSFKLVEGFK